MKAHRWWLSHHSIERSLLCRTQRVVRLLKQCNSICRCVCGLLNLADMCEWSPIISRWDGVSDFGLLVTFGECNFDAFRWLKNDIAPKHWNVFLPALHTVKCLQYPNNRICHLCECKLLSDAYSRPTVERDVRPRLWRPVIPSFRNEVKIIWEAR